MNEDEIIQLEKQVQVLIDWKRGREKERFSLPMDVMSQRTLRYWHTPFFDGLPIFTGKILPVYNTNPTDFLLFGLEININDKKRVLLIQFELKQYTVDPSTNIFTNIPGSHNLNNGDRIAFTTNGTLPTGLHEYDFYYVINRTGTTFQVSLISGGSILPITSSGVGNQYYAKL